MKEKEFIDFMEAKFNAVTGLIYGDFKTVFEMLAEEGYIIIKKDVLDDDSQWNILQRFLDAIRKNSHNIDSMLKRIDELEKVSSK